MKKQFVLTTCVLALAGNIRSQTTSPAPYCAAQIASMTVLFDNHIKAVNIGTLSNSTGSVYFNGSEYAYYTNIAPVTLQKGVTIPVALTVSKHDMELNALWVYVDHNLNNSFEPTELVGQASSTLLANAPFGDVNLNFSINIPATAQAGQSRMRIIYTSDFYLTPQVPTPCNSNVDLFLGNLFVYGEIEDYNVVIAGQTVAAPSASFTSPASACKAQSITLTDNSSNTPTAWSWTLAGGTPSTSAVKNPTVTYASTGTYTVLLSSSNAGGASQTVSKVVTISACTGIDAQADRVAMHVYPNPGNGYFNLESPGAMKLNVYNLAGEMLLHLDLEEGRQVIDLSDQPEGLYILHMQQGETQRILKLIKE